MSWSTFDADSALERDLLQRALPLVPTESDGSSRAVFDMAGDFSRVHVSVVDTLGPNAEGCVELLALRPLLVGAAWKVLDLLLETVLDEAGIQPQPGRRYTIHEKAEHANAARGRPNSLTSHHWKTLAKTYSGTVELRHSLVHRRAHTDSGGSLIGWDETGIPLRPLTAVEQESFVRAVLRAAELVSAATPDRRVEADMTRHLGQLTGLHGEQLPSAKLLDSLIHGLSNARVESMNTRLRLIMRRAFGFRSVEALIGLAMLAHGGLCPPLPGRDTTA